MASVTCKATLHSQRVTGTIRCERVFAWNCVHQDARLYRPICFYIIGLARRVHRFDFDAECSKNLARPYRLRLRG